MFASYTDQAHAASKKLGLGADADSLLDLIGRIADQDERTGELTTKIELAAMKLSNLEKGR